MKIYRYSDLKDSRIMYDRNPPVLFPIIILLVLVLVIVLIFYQSERINLRCQRAGNGTVE